MSRDLQVVRRLLGVITLDQAYTTMSLPIITLIFFANDSSLFPQNTPHATRSVWYGICIAMPYLVNIFFAPLISAVSDEVGRRKTLLFELSSAFLYTLIAGVGVFSGSLKLVVLSFIIRGAFSRTNTTALSIVGDVCNKNSKFSYMSYLQVSISLGACLGPIIGGLIGAHFQFTVFNYSLVFFISALLALTNTCLSYFFIHETLQRPNDSAHKNIPSSRWKESLCAAKYVLSHPDILRLSLILLLLQISWSCYYQFISPFLKTTYHFNAHNLGTFMGMIGFWLLIGSGPAFKALLSTSKPYNILNLGALMMLSGYGITFACCFQLIPGTLPLWVGAMMLAIGDVIAYICITALYSNVVPSHMQGKVTGINFLIIGLVWGCISLTGGLLISYSIILPLLIAPTGAVASLFAINSKSGKELIYQHSI